MKNHTKYRTADLAFLNRSSITLLLQRKLFQLHSKADVSDLYKNESKTLEIIRILKKNINEYSMQALHHYLAASPSTIRKYPGLSNYWDHNFLVYDEDNTLLFENHRHRSSVIVPYKMKTNPEKLAHTQASIEQFIEDQLYQRNIKSKYAVHCYLLTFLSPLILKDKLTCEAPIVNLKHSAIEKLNAQLQQPSSDNEVSIIASKRCAQQKRIFFTQNNIPVNEFRNPKLNKLLASSDYEEQIDYALDRLFYWVKEVGGLSTQILDVVSKSWDEIKAIPITVVPQFDERDVETSFICQLAILYVQLQKKKYHTENKLVRQSSGSTIKQSYTEHDALLIGSIEELLHATLGDFVLASCRSGKDRRGSTLLYEDACTVYVLVNKSYLGISNQSSQSTLLIDTLTSLFVSGHQQRVADRNAKGCMGIKSLTGIIPSDVIVSMTKTHPFIVEHNFVTSNYNRPCVSTKKSKKFISTASEMLSFVKDDNMEELRSKWQLDGIKMRDINRATNVDDTDLLFQGECDSQSADFYHYKKPDKLVTYLAKKRPSLDSQLLSALHYSHVNNKLVLQNKAPVQDSPSFLLSHNETLYEPGICPYEPVYEKVKKKKVSFFRRFTFIRKIRFGRRYEPESETQYKLTNYSKNLDVDKVQNLIAHEAKHGTLNDIEINHTLLTFFLDEIVLSDSLINVDRCFMNRVIECFYLHGASFKLAKKNEGIALSYIPEIIQKYKLFPGNLKQCKDFYRAFYIPNNDRGTVLNGLDPFGQSFLLVLMDEVFLTHLFSSQSDENPSLTLDEAIYNVLSHMDILRQAKMDTNCSHARISLLHHLLTWVTTSVRESNQKSCNARTKVELNIRIRKVLLLVAKLIKEEYTNPFQYSDRKTTSFDSLVRLWGYVKSEQHKKLIRNIIKDCLKVNQGELGLQSLFQQQLFVRREAYFIRCPGFVKTLERDVEKTSEIMNLLLMLSKNEALLHTMITSMNDRMSKATVDTLVRMLNQNRMLSRPSVMCYLYDCDFSLYNNVRNILSDHDIPITASMLASGQSVVDMMKYLTEHLQSSIKQAFEILDVLVAKSNSADLTAILWCTLVNDLLAALTTCYDKVYTEKLLENFLHFIKSHINNNKIVNGKFLTSIVSSVNRVAPLSDNSRINIVDSTILSLNDDDNDIELDSNSIFSVMRMVDPKSIYQALQVIHKKNSFDRKNTDKLVVKFKEACDKEDVVTAIKNFINAENDLGNHSVNNPNIGDDTLLSYFITNVYHRLTANEFKSIIKCFSKKGVDFNLKNTNAQLPLELLIKWAAINNKRDDWINVRTLIRGGADETQLMKNSTISCLTKICQIFTKSRYAPHLDCFAEIILDALDGEGELKNTRKAIIAEFLLSTDEHQAGLLVTPCIEKYPKDADIEDIESILIKAKMPAMLRKLKSSGSERVLSTMQHDWAISKRLLKTFFTTSNAPLLNRYLLILFSNTNDITNTIANDLKKSVFLLYLSLCKNKITSPLTSSQQKYFHHFSRLSSSFLYSSPNALKTLKLLLNAFMRNPDFFSLHQVNSGLAGLLACEKYWKNKPVTFFKIVNDLLKPMLSKSKQSLSSGNNLSRSLDIDLSINQKSHDDNSESDSSHDNIRSIIASDLISNLQSLKNTMFHVTVDGLNPKEIIQAFRDEKPDSIEDCFITLSLAKIEAWLVNDHQKLIDKYCNSKIDNSEITNHLQSAIKSGDLYLTVALLDALVIRTLPPMRLYYTQIIALFAAMDFMTHKKSLDVTEGKFKNLLASIGTGQGKSLFFILTAIFFVIQHDKKQRVHIVSADDIYGHRDSLIFSKLLKELRISYSVGSPDKSQTPALICYTTMQHVAHSCAQKLFSVFRTPQQLDKVPTLGLFDEVDLPMYQTFGASHRRLYTVIKNYKTVIHLIWKKRTQQGNISEDIDIQKAISKHIHPEFQAYVKKQLFELHKTAKLVNNLKNGENYILDGQQIVLVHETTNNVLRGIQGKDGIFQFIAIKEGLVDVKDMYLYGVNLSYEILMQEYCYIIGASGSLGLPQERNEVAQRHNAKIFNVPSYYGDKNKLDHKTPIITDSLDNAFQAVIYNAIQESQRGVLVLILANTIQRVNYIYEKLTLQLDDSSPISKITGLMRDHDTEDKKINNIVSASGFVSDGRAPIVVSTLVGARGNDFPDHAENDVAKEEGRLIIKLGFCENRNQDIQSDGRTARQDNNGAILSVLIHSEIIAYLDKIKKVYKIPVPPTLPKDPKKVMSLLKNLREQVAIKRIPERALAYQNAFSLHYLTMTFYNAIKKYQGVNDIIEYRWAVFLTEISNSIMATPQYDPKNSQHITACCEVFPILNHYEGSFERGIIMAQLLLHRFANFRDLHFDQSPGSAMHKLTGGVTVALSIPISHNTSHIKPTPLDVMTFLPARNRFQSSSSGASEKNMASYKYKP